MYDITGYDNWKLDNGQEEEEVSCYCDHCNEEIYVGDVIYNINKLQTSVHIECFEDYAIEQLFAEKEEAKGE